MRTRVKICGITRPEDGLAAARAGADAIGLVFYAPSPRYVTIEQAQQVVAALPPFVSVVGLFVDATAEQLKETLSAVSIDLLQFHGKESPEACRGWGRPYIKALRMKDDMNIQQAAEDYADAAGLLLDSYQPGVPGGTGQTFDWSRIPSQVDKPIILAGGLTPDNVAAAIQEVRPYAVDVSGGVEASRGIKDAAKIEQLMRGVVSVEQHAK